MQRNCYDERNTFVRQRSAQFGFNSLDLTIALANLLDLTLVHTCYFAILSVYNFQHLTFFGQTLTYQVGPGQIAYKWGCLGSV